MTLGHAENLLFGKTDQLGDVLGFVVRHTLNLGRRADQLTLNIFLSDDFSVKFDVRRRSDLLRQLRKIWRSTDLFELTF